MKRLRKKFQSGQTALEYALILAAVIIPLASAVQSLLSDSKDGARDNVTQKIVSDSYGDEKRMGTIGRPYP